MDEIIVAKKAKGSGVALLIVVILGVLLVLLAAALALLLFGAKSNNSGAILEVGINMVAGIMVLGVGVNSFLSYKSTPEIMIMYFDGQFLFADGTTCKPDEITYVSAGRRYGRYGSLTRTGRLEVTINNSKTIKYFYVARVEEASSTIQTIKNEYYASLLNQMQDSKS